MRWPRFTIGLMMAAAFLTRFMAASWGSVIGRPIYRSFGRCGLVICYPDYGMVAAEVAVMVAAAVAAVASARRR